MKIKIKQTFRSMWATILAVLMLLSTFTAVAVTLNKEDTGANVDIVPSGYDATANCIFFDNSKTQWSTVYIYFYKSGYNEYSSLKRIDGTDLWYRQYNWGGYGGFRFSDSNNNPSNYTDNLTQDVKDATLFSPQSAGGTSIGVDSSTTFNVTRDAAIMVDNTGSGTYATLNSDIPGTITISGKSISGTTLTSQTDTSSSTDADVSVSVSQGTNATLTYTPTNSNYEFVGWSTDSTESNIFSTEPSYTYKVTNGAKYYALVKKKITNHNLTVTFEEGSVKVNDSSVSSGTATAIAEGAGYTVSITPPDGKVVDTFTVGGENQTLSGNTYTGTMGTSDVAINVTFKDATYTVTSKSSITGGAVYVGSVGTTSQETNYNGEVTVIAVPAENYFFKGWTSASGVTFTDSKSATTTATITSDVTIEAEFMSKDSNWKVVGTGSAFGGWDYKDGKPLYITSTTATDNIVTRDFVLSANTEYQFKLHNGTDYCSNSSSGATTVQLSTEYTMDKTGGSGNHMNFTPNSTGTYTFTFNTSTKKLTITKVNQQHEITVDDTTTNGTVSVDGIDDLTKVDSSTTVTLSNSPETGYELDKYEVYKTGDPSTIVNVTNGTFTMPDHDVTVSAKFKLKSYTITANVSGAPDDTAITVSPATATINDTVTLTAPTVTGYTFQSWSSTNAVLVSESDNEYKIKPNGSGDVTVTATYTINNYKINKVTSTTDDCDFTVQENADYKSTVNIVVTTKTGWTVAENGVVVTIQSVTPGSTVNVTKVDDTHYSFEMPAGAVQVAVTFTEATYTVSKGTETNGKFTVSKTSAKMGDTITVEPTASEGYNVSKVSYTYGSTTTTVTDTGSGYSFTMPASNVTVNVTFAPQEYAIATTPPQNGSLTVEPGTSATYGQNVTVTATPTNGYQLSKITINNASTNEVYKTLNANGTFTMPAYAVKITAEFTVSKGTLKSDYRVLYAGNTSTQSLTAITANVYQTKENGRDRFTGYIEDSIALSNIATDTTISLGISSTNDYKGLLNRSNSQSVSTDTPEYVRNIEKCEDYYDGAGNFRVKFSLAKNNNYSLITITNYDYTYKVNAYVGTPSSTYTLKATVNDPTMGTATVRKTTDATASSSVTVDPNTSVTFVATPNTGYIFDGWYNSETKVSDLPRYTFDATSSLTLQARFKSESSGKIYVKSADAQDITDYNQLTNLVELTSSDGGTTYTGTASLTSQNYYLAIYDPVNSSGLTSGSGKSGYYFVTAETKVGTPKEYYNYGDNYKASPLKDSSGNTITAGSYKFTWTPIDDSSKRGTLLVEESNNEFITEATISINESTIDLNDSATITVNATPVNGFTGNRTYNLVDASTGSSVQSVDTTENTATFTVAPTSAGNYNYKVIISTTETDGGGNSYSPFTTESVTLTVNTSTIYYANTGTGTPGTATATAYNFETGLGSINLSSVTAGNSYTFSLFTSASSKDVDHSVNYNIDTSALKNVKMTAGTLEDGTPTYTVTLNPSCTGLNVYFDSSSSKIWATATYSESLGKTFDSNEVIKYYFAEPTKNTDLSLTGAGVKIKYWNNSCTGKEGTVEVTTPVNVKVNDSNSNTITVRPEKFYNSPASWNGAQTFNVYSVDLPVWATTFQFLDTSNNAIKSSSNSTSSSDGAATYALNPNRIYCLYKDDSTYYTKGVVLDESFWTNTSRTDNEVNTKAFTSHLVDYKNGSTAYSTELNTALSNKYGTSYSRPLYVGNFYTDADIKDSLNNYKRYYNLAQSYKDASYYASIRNLVNSQLNTISEQSGFYQLTNYDSSDPQPLFDYGNMGDDIGTVYNNVDFPLYESSFDGVTTYSYDSTTDANRSFSTTNSTYSITAGEYALGKDAGGTSYTGFFPFGGNTDSYSKTGFGTELDINFYMTDTGYLKGTTGNKDIAFNFSGDDDVWVFVDGVKVLDLGGDHKISAGSINFSDMKVYYKSASIDAGSEILSKGGNAGSWSTNTDYVSTVDLGDLMSAYGVDFSKTDSSTQHTLQMFYMERGAFQSNMSVSFNLPQNTGLRVNNTVNTNSVNEGLKDAALNRANADYFSYGISNALATSSQISALATHFKTTLPSAATASSFSTGSFTSAIPKYPMDTTSTVVRRKIGATEYYLTAPNMSKSESVYYWGSLGEGFTDLNNINYSLADYYAATDTTDGSTEASGRVTSGIFNLLFNESATFDSKIPSNTLVKLYQSNQLAYVSAGDGTNSVISKGTNSRLVSNYYTTNYKIVDDDSGKIIGSAEGTLGSTGDVYADDASSTLENSFYFANYSGDSSSSSNAVTIDYENVVQTGDIKVSKSVSDGKASSTDLFYFTLKFRNVFGAGETAETEYKDYKDLTYKVYNNSSAEPVATRTYGSAGIYLLANQYAVIEGVPVGTEYQITEKERSGYAFVSASGSVVISDGTPLASVTQPTSEPLYRNISGSIPNVSDANNNVGTVNTVTFTNSKVPFTITFKYYDHQVVNGQPANINTTPTTFSVSLETIPEKFLTFNVSGDQTGIKFSDLIAACYYGKVGSASNEAAGTRLQPRNVIDDYLVFTSQSGAVAQVKSLIDYQNNDKTTEHKYSDSYTDEQLARHFDCYGRTSANSAYSVTDTENWVTYYTNGGKTVDETTACASVGNTISGVSVWLFNRPVKYTLSFVTPGSDGKVTAIAGHDGYYVGSTTDSNNTQTAFYNMRLGTSNTEWKNNLAGAYLNAYGIPKGYTGSYPSTPATATCNGVEGDLDFLYWSYDAEGYEIASTDIQYGYRITSTETLYAIYGNKNNANIKKSPGLSLNAVQPDYYIDGNGIQRTRLNTVMNVYNCDSNDKNIKQAAVVYVQDQTKNGLTSDQLKAVSNAIKTEIATKSKGTAVNFVVTVESAHTASGFVYDIVSYGSEASAYEAVLTNKNRLQFSNGFKSASLISIGTVYAFAGMNYQGTGTDGKEYNNWIMADNAIKYSFTGNNVIETSASSIVIPNS